MPWRSVAESVERAPHIIHQLDVQDRPSAAKVSLKGAAFDAVLCSSRSFQREAGFMGTLMKPFHFPQRISNQ